MREGFLEEPGRVEPMTKQSHLDDGGSNALNAFLLGMFASNTAMRWGSNYELHARDGQEVRHRGEKTGKGGRSGGRVTL